MTQPPQPLSYENLKAVILHMDFNSRFLISQKLPSLQLTEKLMPSKIKNVTLTPSSIEINGVTYKLDIVKFYPSLGFLRRNGKDYTSHEDEEQNDHLHATVLNLDISQEQVKSEKPGTWQEARDTYIMGRKLCGNQIESGYFHFFRFMFHLQNFEQLEHFECFKTYQVALHYFFQKILGGREIPISIDTLKLKDRLPLNLPIGLKLNVRHLEGNGYDQMPQSSGLENIRPFLTNLPLETIKVARYDQEDQEVLKLAKMVVSTDIYPMGFPLSPPFPRMHFCYPSVDVDVMIGVIRDWRRDEREIGTHFTFELPHVELEDTSDCFRREPGVETRIETGTRLFGLPEHYALAINTDTEVLVNFDATQHSYSNSCFLLHMRIVEKHRTIKSLTPSAMSPNCRNAVLRNMEADFRLALTENTVLYEKNIPLKIENLAVNTYGFDLGITNYDLVVAQYEQGDNGYRQSLNCSRINHDVDKYGIRLPPTELMPGDIDFKSEKAWKSDEKELEELEKKLSDMEDDDRIREKIDRFLMRKEHLKPKYKYFLQLTTFRRGVKIVETVEYNGNLAMARKYLMEKILGGRSQIFVKNLGVYGDEDLGVLRLPDNLKISVKHLSIYGNRVPLKEIAEKILCPSSILDSIGIDDIHEDDDDILRAAKQIVIVSPVVDPLPVPQPLPYLNVCFAFGSAEQVLAIVKEWKTDRRCVGTHFSFAIKSFNGEKAMEWVYNEDGAQIGELKNNGSHNLKSNDSLCVVIPIDEHSEINIYQYRTERQWNWNFPLTHDHHTDQVNSGTHSILEMWLRPKGFAKVWQI